MPGRTSTTSIGRHAHGVRTVVATASRTGSVSSSVRVSATTMIASRPRRRSLPNAMTFPAADAVDGARGAFDVFGEQVPAADDDHVLEAPAHDEAPVEQVREVAGAEPTVAEGGLGGFGVGVVPGRDRRAADRRARPPRGRGERSPVSGSRMRSSKPAERATEHRQPARAVAVPPAAGRGVPLVLERVRGRRCRPPSPRRCRGTSPRAWLRPSRTPGTPPWGRTRAGAAAAQNASTAAGSTGSAPLSASRHDDRSRPLWRRNARAASA